MTGRRTCTSCGEIYHIKSKPCKASEVCDKCGSKVVQRPDDREDVIVERLAQFEKNTGPTIEYYRSKKALIEIDSAKESQVVFEEIQRSLSLLN